MKTELRDIFKENSTYKNKTYLKKYLVEYFEKPYSCDECGNSGRHNGRELSLQLDHINGVCEDHRVENLRFLCPNCHSQTDTYAGKATKGKRNKMTRAVYDNAKLIRDREIINELKKDIEIRFGEWGWKVRLSRKLGLTSQKVAPWLRRVDPSFLAECEGLSKQK